MTRLHSILLLGLIVLAGAGARLVHLDAEGSTTYPNGLYSDAPLKDESAKGFAARSRVRFGAWTASPVDDYRYWEILSPVWTWTEYAWFSAFGPGYRSARTFSVLWSVVSMIFIFLILERRSRLAALFGAGFFAFNYYALMIGRMGLLETQMHAWLLASFYFLSRADERPALLGPAWLLWLAAWLVKQSAITFLPVLTLGVALQWAQTPEQRRGLLAWGGGCLAVAAAVVGGLLLWPDYYIRSVMNLRHTLNYFPDRTYLWMEFSADTSFGAIRYNLGRGFITGYLAMFPLSGMLALIGVAGAARRRWQRQPADLLVLLLAVWWLSARAALTLQGQAFPRFYLVQAPSVFLLGAIVLAELQKKLVSGSGRKLAVAAVAAVLVLAAVVNLAPWAGWVQRRPHELERAGQWLTAKIGDQPAVVVGEWANPFCFDTPYKSFYLKSVFNRTSEQVLAIHPTHLLVVEGKEGGEDMDPAVRRLRKFFPTVYDQRVELAREKFWPGTRDEATVILYRLAL